MAVARIVRGLGGTRRWVEVGGGGHRAEEMLGRLDARVKLESY